MFKKIIFLYSFLVNIFFISIANAATREVGNGTIRDVLLGITDNDVLPSDGDGLSMLDNIFIWIKDSLTGLIVLIAVGAFLFIGIRLAMARGNPEEFKKAINQLIYAIVGIFIVAFAWAAVTLVAGLNL
ncbi:MAG: hypothetical protein Q8K30_00290 [Candidatus Gracilibacteria bacterium]|nr:hypothetical protein [Candidatus Gracilibacteria bacterium]